jgi:RNA polymerase sigma factor (sigma-70 family)
MTDDPADLVSRYLDGDTPAARDLARRVGRIAVPLASAALGSRDRAEDVASDVVIDVLRGVGQLRDRDRLDAWVRAIAARHVVRAARRERVRLEHERPLDGIDVSAAGTDLADDVAATMAVRTALSALPARQRVAIALRYIHDLSEIEVAHALGCRPGTAASLLSRGREALRRDPGIAALRTPTALDRVS